MTDLGFSHSLEADIGTRGRERERERGVGEGRVSLILQLETDATGILDTLSVFTLWHAHGFRRVMSKHGVTTLTRVHMARCTRPLANTFSPRLLCLRACIRSTVTVSLHNAPLDAR